MRPLVIPLVASLALAAPARAQDVVYAGDDPALASALALELATRRLTLAVVAPLPASSLPSLERAARGLLEARGARALVVVDEAARTLTVVSARDGTRVAEIPRRPRPRLIATVAASLVQEAGTPEPAPLAARAPNPSIEAPPNDPSEESSSEEPPGDPAPASLAPYLGLRHASVGYDGFAGGVVLVNELAVEAGLQLDRTVRIGLSVAGPFYLRRPDSSFAEGTPGLAGGLAASVRGHHDRLELRVGLTGGVLGRRGPDPAMPSTEWRLQWGLRAAVRTLLGVRLGRGYALLGGLSFAGVLLEGQDPFGRLALTVEMEWF